MKGVGCNLKAALLNLFVKMAYFILFFKNSAFNA